MTAIQWIKLLEYQFEKYNKRAFTITELAALSGMSRASLHVKLNRFVKSGVFVRYIHGLYGLKKWPPEQIINYFDTDAYCTGHYALFKNGFITQVPTTVTCFTNKRHMHSNRMPIESNAYILEFVLPSIKIFDSSARPNASPERAFCDFIFLCRDRGVTPDTFVTFRKLASLDKNKIRGLLPNYPKTVQNEALRILKELCTEGQVGVINALNERPSLKQKRPISC